MAIKDVVNFMSLMLDGKQVGRQILKELLQSSGAGIRAVINTTGYEPHKIAKLIRDENAHAIIWHPTEMLYKFASSLHANIAKHKMALIDTPGEKDVLSLLSCCAASWCIDVFARGHGTGAANNHLGTGECLEVLVLDYIEMQF